MVLRSPNQPRSEPADPPQRPEPERSLGQAPSPSAESAGTDPPAIRPPSRAGHPGPAQAIGTLLTCLTGPRIRPSRITHANADSYPPCWVLSSVDKGIRDASERARTSDPESRTDATRPAPKGRRGRSPPSREDQPALNDGSAASPRFAISCARRWRPKQRAIT